MLEGRSVSVKVRSARRLGLARNVVPMIIVTDERCTEYAQAGHPENPARIVRTRVRLEETGDFPVRWEGPGAVTEAQLLRAHTPEHLARLRIERDFDMDTPAHAGIREHAERSVGAALRTLDRALERRPVFSLMRPPGHHATADRAMGFCYLSNAAITALEARARGIDRVGVFDFDVHHGNGTESLLLGVEGCSFHSVHQYPAYPGTGEISRDNAHNHPVLPGATRATYQTALREALEELAAFRPELVIVSAGFDAYRGDPLSSAPLEAEDYAWLGAELSSLGAPLCSLLEGGYSADLPDLVLAYLGAVEERLGSRP